MAGSCWNRKNRPRLVRTLRVLSCVVPVIGVVLYIIGYSASKFVAFDNKDFDCDRDDPAFDKVTGVKVDQHIGLWRQCRTHRASGMTTKEACEAVDNEQGWKPASKILCSLGLSFSMIGLVIAFASMCRRQWSLMNASGTLFILGGVTGAMGGITFVGKCLEHDDRLHPHFSAYLDILSCVLLVTSGALQLTLSATADIAYMQVV